MAVLTNLLGVVRRASLAGAVLRMIGLQLGAALFLIAWGTWRLRPASRAIAAGEGRTLFRRTSRTRWRPRPPCGDDPVLWYELHSTRGITAGERLIGVVGHAIAIIVFGLAVWEFARPAFAELGQLGYGAAPGRLSMPDVQPAARLLVKTVKGLTSYSTAPGHARWELNIVLRQASAGLGLALICFLGTAAAEGIAGERERCTWDALLATPLSAREIIRAKMLGAFWWRGRACAVWMLVIWTVGLVAGAVHPIGFLAALVGLLAAAWFATALGTYASLWAKGREQATGWAILATLWPGFSGLLPLVFPPGTGSVLVAAGSPPFLIWASLLSYDDVQSASRAGTFPLLDATGIHTGDGAIAIVAVWIIGTVAQLIGAAWLTRAAIRKFDGAVGRPRRAGQPGKETS
jgi:hypothetical protein